MPHVAPELSPGLSCCSLLQESQWGQWHRTCPCWHGPKVGNLEVYLLQQERFHMRMRIRLGIGHCYLVVNNSFIEIRLHKQKNSWCDPQLPLWQSNASSPPPWYFIEKQQRTLLQDENKAPVMSSPCLCIQEPYITGVKHSLKQTVKPFTVVKETGLTCIHHHSAFLNIFVPLICTDGNT